MRDVTQILSEWLNPIADALNVDAARQLVDLRADEETQTRVEELADRNTEGQLTPEERSEYETLVAATAMVNVLQAKARKRLANEGGTAVKRQPSEPTAA